MVTGLFKPETLKIGGDLLFEFFVAFSKFEFALKNSTFLRGDDTKADPDWDRFAASLKDSFKVDSNPQLKQACEIFLVNPPWKQVVVNGKLAWSAAGPDETLSDAERILLLVRRVRNNLFHGGKFGAEMFEDTERQERLLTSAMVVLAECLKLSPDVRNFFDAAAI